MWEFFLHIFLVYIAFLSIRGIWFRGIYYVKGTHISLIIINGIFFLEHKHFCHISKKILLKTLLRNNALHATGTLAWFLYYGTETEGNNFVSIFP